MRCIKSSVQPTTKESKSNNVPAKPPKGFLWAEDKNINKNRNEKKQYYVRGYEQYEVYLLVAHTPSLYFQIFFSFFFILNTDAV